MQQMDVEKARILEEEMNKQKQERERIVMEMKK